MNKRYLITREATGLYKLTISIGKTRATFRAETLDALFDIITEFEVLPKIKKAIRGAHLG